MLVTSVVIGAAWMCRRFWLLKVEQFSCDLFNQIKKWVTNHQSSSFGLAITAGMVALLAFVGIGVQLRHIRVLKDKVLKHNNKVFEDYSNRSLQRRTKESSDAIRARRVSCTF